MSKKIIALDAPVSITAAQDDGDKKTPPTFEVTAYTGGPMNIRGWDLPVVIDLAGLQFGKSLIANLDHDPRQRVGHVTATSKSDGKLVLSGVASAATEYAREVVASAANGFVWQASVEVVPSKVIELANGKTAVVNGQTITGPAYITRKGTLKGFGFVSHGADDNTTVAIAATAVHSNKGISMDPQLRQWIEAMGFDPDELSEAQLAGLKANYEGKSVKRSAIKAADPFEEARNEAKRRSDIEAIGKQYCSRRDPGDIEFIESMAKMVQHAIDNKMSAQEFRIEAGESLFPMAHTVPTPRNHSISNRVIQAAICQAGRYTKLEQEFTDQELQLAHDKFRGGIGLKQLFLLCAEANGYDSRHSFDVTLDVQRAAFDKPRSMIRAQGFSTLDIATIISSTANKFVMEGWNAVDQTCLRISKIQPVRDFKTITTVSLTDNVIYEKVGAAGEIKHGTLDEITYTNKADTYARMLAITRNDIINDDLGALTDVPRKLGNGAIKKLNDIFWTEFLVLVTDAFFATANKNLNEGAADMTIGGLAATETLFMNQTNPDGTPLGIMPEIILVPTALKATAVALMDPQGRMTGGTSSVPDANPFKGRFRVESSPYISNSSYTGYTSTGWWMMANPSTLPLIAIAALNGRVEPTVDTADAEFNTLGVQMRGYADVGVKRQEYRAAVYADGNSS